METGNTEALYCSPCSGPGDQSYTNRYAAVQRTSSKRNVDGGSKELPRTISQFLEKYLISPPQLCVMTTMYLQNKNLRFMDGEDKEFKKELNYYNRMILGWTLNDLFQHYSQPGRDVCFTAVNMPFSSIYHDLTTSIAYLNTFLQFQLEEKAEHFLCYLYIFLNRLAGKKNGLVLVGAPNGGKSWFMSIIKSLQINYCSTSILNRTNNFAFSGTENAKLMILDELNYDPDTWGEQLKLLLAGEDMTVSVKYKNDQLVQKLPTVIMSNNPVPIPRTTAFAARCTYLRFKKADSLPIFHRKIHPFAFMHLLYKVGDGKLPSDSILYNGFSEIVKDFSY